MKRISVVLASLLMFLIVGCGPPKLDNGNIYRKTFEPERDFIMFLPITCGQYCTMMIPFTFRDDPDWILWLKNCEPQPSGKENGVIIHKRGCRQGVAYVDEPTYEQAQIGTWFDVHKVKPPAEATTDDPNKKGGRKHG